MLIIIEGVDKCGKTTLGNYLLKALPNAYMLKNGTKPADGSYTERQKIKEAYEKMASVYSYGFKDSILIIDRYLISEYVYCIKRGYNAEKDRELQETKELIESFGDVVLIYCKTDQEAIEKKFIQDEEEYAKIDEIKTLCNRYDLYISKFSVEKLPYNYKTTDKEAVAKKLLQMKERFDKEFKIKQQMR